MSTTGSQKRKNFQQENNENVSDGFVSPVVVENPSFSKQDANTAGPSKPKFPRIENRLLESLRASLKEEITSEIKNLFIESQKEMMKLLRPETRENVRENVEEVGNESRSLYTPTRSVRISSTQNDQDISRNNAIGLALFELNRRCEVFRHPSFSFQCEFKISNNNNNRTSHNTTIVPYLVRTSRLSFLYCFPTFTLFLPSWFDPVGRHFFASLVTKNGLI